VADVPDKAEPERPRGERHTREALMAHIASVVTEQLDQHEQRRNAAAAAQAAPAPAAETAPEQPEAVPAGESDVIAQVRRVLSEMSNVTPEQWQDANRYLPQWAERAHAFGWTPTEQARLIIKITGREVRPLTPPQVTVGTKMIYRHELGIH
jgi:hypothetical protein